MNIDSNEADSLLPVRWLLIIAVSGATAYSVWRKEGLGSGVMAGIAMAALLATVIAP
ncbi:MULTISPECIES: hypothetical protein [Streptomyces]|uniref:hypothetical protein n=1 Tax=Streptomyces TaxID=1883 RepID=UPI000804ED7D|nr:MULTISPECIES: hypothetical protein [unclassified Streptomyces]MYT79105.1 hypothetical protein [Streptomyces sp. SID8364]SBU92702.1 hypothetical protein YW3DRAFT_04790 [Streptomyces sp. MnatMP-M77]SCE56279.1 hypothetical protein GA0115261_107851 [Streptomyces sp. OspMP-M43]